MHRRIAPLTRCTVAALVAGLAAGCDAGTSADETSNVPEDARVAVADVPLDPGRDVSPYPDAAPDAMPDATPDAAADAAVDPQDATPPAPDVPAMPATCPPPPDTPAPAAGRWSLSMFHFNVQYVAGGTEGFAETALRNPGSARLTDFSEAEVEDHIIVESFEPLLDLLLRNPDFALTLEMQGYMVDLIVARHPGILQKMQALTASAQVELASIHWSDQFFLAFTRDSLEEGRLRTEASFAAADLPLSPVVFTQEGQFGPGFGAWLAQARPGAIMVMPRNLQGFFQGELADAPLFTARGLDVVLPRGLSDATAEKSFNYFDDGELLATGGLDPYFGSVFVHRPTAVAEYERELRCAVENGVRVGRVADYVEAVRAAGYTPAEMPPVLDGTWQPKSTRGTLRWMGGGGGFRQHERDNDVLMACVSAERAVRALQRAAGTVPDAVWQDLLLGQVSDARGLNPWRGEVQYGLRHCDAARTAAEQGLAAVALRAGWAAVEVDLASGAVGPWLQAPPAAEQPVEAPFEVRVEAEPRPYTLAWTQVPGDTHRWFLTVTWAPAPEFVAARDACLARGSAEHACDTAAIPLKLVFPRAPGAIGMRPAFTEALETYTEADFRFPDDARDDAVWLPIGDGWVDLGNGFHVIKDLSRVHLAFGFPAGEGRNAEVWMLDETQPPHQPATWRFTITDDASLAHGIADANLNPRVVVQAQ